MTTATLLPNAKQTFWDANGDPLAGGSVTFYVPNSNTLKNTWQDSTQSTLNSNPVILDAAGEAIIYGVGSYRQVVKDSLDNLIWDQLTADTLNLILGTNNTWTGTNTFTNSTTFSAAVAISGNITSTGGSNSFSGSTSFTGPVIFSSSILTTARSISSNTTVATSDTGKTLVLTGGFISLTFDTASGYSSNHTTTVINFATETRGKKIIITGGANFILWPGQTATIRNENNTWAIDKPVRWKAPGSTTLYVNVDNGLDTNDGLAAGAGNAVQTIFQAVINIVQDQWDLTANSAPQIIIQLADSSNPYAGLHFPGPVVGMSGNATILIQGNQSDPRLTTISTDAQNNCLNLFDGAILEIKWVQVDNTSGGAIVVQTNAICRIVGDVWFKRATGGAHMLALLGGKIILDAGYTIANQANFHAQAIGGGTITKSQALTVTFVTSPTFTTFVYAQQLSYQGWGGVTFNLQGNTVTGQRYYADTNSVITVDGGGATFLPGSIAGATATGGQYI